jgi:hypothetical protein
MELQARFAGFPVPLARQPPGGEGFEDVAAQIGQAKKWVVEYMVGKLLLYRYVIPFWCLIVTIVAKYIVGWLAHSLTPVGTVSNLLSLNILLTLDGGRAYRRRHYFSGSDRRVGTED